jgi:hypothetical protein
MVEETYIKRDLIDYVNGTVEDNIVDEDAEYEFNRYPSTRPKAVRQCLPESATVHVESEGSYQGEQVLIIECDGYIWLRHGRYGSCSVCDAYQNDPVSETERICRGAYCFETVDDAVAYLETTEDFGWRSDELRSDTIETVESIR